MLANHLMSDNTLALERIDDVLDAVYRWSADQGYRGYNKHDALNSPLLKVLLGWGKWPRITAIQSVMRFPLNLRPLLLVPKTYNPKGLALFAQGFLDRYRKTHSQAHLAAAEHLLDLLLSLRSPGLWAGDCWGYQYPWRDLGFYAPKCTPNAVVTSFVCEAYLDAYRVTGKAQYLDTVSRTIAFFLEDLTVLKNESEELCLAYMPLSMRMRVMDVSILIGSVLAQYAQLSGESESLPIAERLVAYVVGQQTEYGAWYYTDPPGDSHVRHDNYHTGFILDALLRYMEAADDFRWSKNYHAGLDYYRRHLFTNSGAPRWMSDCEYPYDIHGAAQGILTFARHQNEHPGFAIRIAQWALASMYHPSGRFYYQKNRFFRKKFTLLRWCNAWMARALSRLSLVASDWNEDDRESKGALRRRSDWQGHNLRSDAANV